MVGYIMSYLLVYSFDIGVTGTSLYGQLIDMNLANEGGAFSTGVVEDSYGWYFASVTIPDSFRGWLRLYSGTNGDSFMRFAINPEEAEYATTPADIWSYPSRTLTSPVASTQEENNLATISIYRDTTWVMAIENLGSLANRSKLWFTIKRDYDDIDEDAMMQVEEGAGLIYADGLPAVTSSWGTLVVDDVPTGDITVTIAANAQSALQLSNRYVYGIKILRSTGTAISYLGGGSLVVLGAATRSIT